MERPSVFALIADLICVIARYEKENHDSLLMRLSEGQRLVRMQYVSKEVSEALVSQITKGFGIDVNIIFGDIDIVADTPVEGIVAIFDDEPVRIDAALSYLRQRNIAAEVLKEG